MLGVQNDCPLLVRIRRRPLRLRHVLVLCKQTRFQTESFNLGHTERDLLQYRTAGGPEAAGRDDDRSSSNDDHSSGSTLARKKHTLRRELSSRGLNYNRLHDSYAAHADAVGEIVAALQDRGIAYDMAVSNHGEESDFPRPYRDYDAIFAAGGDGTFLKAASEIFTMDVPLIGVNTDPTTSKGALCSVASSAHFGACLDRLATGAFEWSLKSRIRVSLEHFEAEGSEGLGGPGDADGSSGGHVGSSPPAAPAPDSWTRLKRVALNEIFFAERNVAHPIQHEVIVDGDATGADVQLSSGILISTGTGSEAWMANATRIDEEVVARVLQAYRSGQASGSGGAGMEEEEEEEEEDWETTIARCTETVNRASDPDRQLAADSSQVRYFVREVVSNGLRPPIRNRGGLAHSVTIRSRGWDPTMTLDGIHAYPLPAGERAHFDTDPSVALLSCSFPEADDER